MTWPSTSVPATAPTLHGEVRTQAYMTNGGDVCRSGRWMIGTYAPGASAVTLMVANQLYLRPFLVLNRQEFDRIGSNNSIGGSAGSVVRYGIWANAGGVPGALLVDSGTTTATGTTAQVAISVTLDTGLYWVGVAAQGTPTTQPNMRNFSTTSVNPWVSPSTAPPTTTSSVAGLYGSASGAFSSNPTILGTDVAPMIQLRAL